MIRMATVASEAPSASDPTSPMKISAGYELYQRNPSDAPTSDPLNTVNSATGGQRIFRMAPLHHHFELSGWSEPKVITRFVIVGIIFALFSLATLKLR